MKYTTLPNTNLSLSRFIFGTANLFKIGGRKKRISLLEAAVDSGFSHFDTAPYYGFGTSEIDLSSILLRYQHITVTNKVGLYSPGGEYQSSAMILMRKVAGRLIPIISKPCADWHVERARLALRGSLQRLGRDCIDLYMLHEPNLLLIRTDEWLRWMESENHLGHVKYFGIAGNASLLSDFVSSCNPLAMIVQTNDSLNLCEADFMQINGRPLQITYGYISSLRKNIASKDVRGILTSALNRNKTGAIIVSTSKIKNLSNYSAISDSTS